MIKTLATVALALAGMNNAQSIGITLDRFQVQIGSNEIEMYPPLSRFHSDNEAAFYEIPSYQIDWIFANNASWASLGGGIYVRGGEFLTGSRWEFSLSEPVTYEMGGLIRHSEWISTSYSEIVGSIDGREGIGSVLDVDISAFPGLHGILNAGQHVFEGRSFALNAESSSSVWLLLTPVGVPDSGSTLLLLGLALGVIGILRHEVHMDSLS